MINKSLIIKYDNKQILKLIIKNFMKLFIKLWHVNIHNHWLQQEHSQQRVQFSWTSMQDMIADDLIKVLFCQWHKQFLRQIKLEDISECLWQKKRMKTLQDKIKDSWDQSSEDKSQKMMFLTHKDVRMQEYDYNDLYREV